MPLRLVAVVFTTSFSVCAGCTSLPPAQPDLNAPPVIVRIEPAQEFTDSGIEVQEGDAFFFTAIGQVQWDAKGKTVTSTPDGINPWIGVEVGRGGLVGRIDPGGKPFDIGARTTLFKNRNIHSHRYHPPPPLRMPRSGHLLLGFKKFQPDHPRGAFEVTIRRVKQ